MLTKKTYSNDMWTYCIIQSHPYDVHRDGIVKVGLKLHDVADGPKLHDVTVGPNCMTSQSAPNCMAS